MNVSFLEGQPISAGNPTHKRNHNNNSSKTKGSLLPLYKISRKFYVTLDMVPYDRATLTLRILIDNGTEVCFKQVKNLEFFDIQVAKTHEEFIFVKPIYQQGQLLIESTSNRNLSKVRLTFTLRDLSKKKAIGRISNTELPIYYFLLKRGGMDDMYRPYVFGVINRGKPEHMQRKYAKLIDSKYSWLLDANQILCHSDIKLGEHVYCPSLLEVNLSLSNIDNESQSYLCDWQPDNNLNRLETGFCTQQSVNAFHIDLQMPSQEEMQVTSTPSFIDLLLCDLVLEPQTQHHKLLSPDYEDNWF
jgi:hypothetical protein